MPPFIWGILKAVSQQCSLVKRCFFKRNPYLLFLARIIPANPIAPIAASGNMPALVVVGTAALVEAVSGSGVSSSSGRVVVAVRIFVCAELKGGTTLTI
jgi:hypothetical protein